MNIASERTERSKPEHHALRLTSFIAASIPGQGTFKSWSQRTQKEQGK